MRLKLPSLTLLLLLQHTVAAPVPTLDDTIQTRQEPHLRQPDAFNSASMKRDQTGKPQPTETPLRRKNDGIPMYALYDRSHRSLDSDPIANEADQSDLTLRASPPRFTQNVAQPTKNPFKRVANAYKGNGKLAFRTVTVVVAGATGYSIYNHLKGGQNSQQQHPAAPASAPPPPPGKRDEQTHLDEEQTSLSQRKVSSDGPNYIDKRRVSRGAQLGIAVGGGVLALGAGWGLYRQVHKGKNEDYPAMEPTAPPPTGAPPPHRKRSVVETDEPAVSSLYKRGDTGMDDGETVPNTARTNEEIDPRMAALAKYGVAAVAGTGAGLGLLAWVKSRTGQAHRRRSIAEVVKAECTSCTDNEKGVIDTYLASNDPEGATDAVEDDTLDKPSELTAREEVDPRMAALAKYGVAAVAGTGAGLGLLAWVKSRTGQAHRRRSIAEGAKDESAALVDPNEGRLHSSSDEPPHKVDSAGLVNSTLTSQGAPDELQENEPRPVEAQDELQVASDESNRLMEDGLAEDDQDGHSLEARLNRNHFSLLRDFNNHIPTVHKVRWGVGAVATVGLGLGAWQIHSQVTKKHDKPAEAPGPAPAPTSGADGHHRRSLAVGEALIDEPPLEAR